MEARTHSADREAESERREAEKKKKKTKKDSHKRRFRDSNRFPEIQDPR